MTRLNPFNPLLTIYSATTRRTESGQVVSGDEAVSREEALRMMTSAAARFSFDEKDSGSIEAGKFGDFVILDDHLMTVSCRTVADTPAGHDRHRRAGRVRTRGRALTAPASTQPQRPTPSITSSADAGRNLLTVPDRWTHASVGNYP